MRRFLQILLLASTVASLVGCKTAQRIGNRVKPDKFKKTDHLLAGMKEKEFKPSTVSYKVSGKMTDGDKSNSFKLNIRMRPDSVIWISVTAYSYEAARLLATPDSLFMINRAEKKYFKGDYEFINQRLNVDIDFQSLQAILLANSIGLEEMDKVKRSPDKDYYLLSSYRKAKLKKMQKKEDKFDELVFSNWVDPETYRIAKLAILDLRFNQTAKVTYSEFSEEGGYIVPHGMLVEIAGQKMITIDNEIYRYEVNEELSFPFKISSKYERMD
jgi:hypothetical protein